MAISSKQAKQSVTCIHCFTTYTWEGIGLLNTVKCVNCGLVKDKDKI